MSKSIENLSNKLTVADKMSPFVQKLKDQKQHLITLQIDLSDFCVCKCNGCSHWQWDNKKQLDYEVLKTNVLDHLSKFQDLQSIVLSGGEPLIHNKVEDLCDFCHKEKGLNVGIITSALGKKKTDWQRLSENCKWIRISIDAFTNEGFHVTRGVPLFDEWTRNLDTLLACNEKTGCKTRLNFTIHQYNVDYCTENVLNFINQRDVGIQYWISRELIEAFRIDQMEDIRQKIISKIQEIDDPRINFDNVKKHLYKRNKIEYKSCYIPQIFGLIAADGNIFPCCYMYEPVFTIDKQEIRFVVGNIYKDSIDKIYESDEFYRITKIFSECEKKFNQCQYCDRFDYVNEFLNNNKDVPITEVGQKQIFL